MQLGGFGIWTSTHDFGTQSIGVIKMLSKLIDFFTCPYFGMANLALNRAHSVSKANRVSMMAKDILFFLACVQL